MPAATDAEAPCVIDIEASGFGRDSYPIEVGFVLPSGRGVCTLVRPPPQWTHWDAQAERVHGISRATAMRHGRDPEVVADLLNDHLDGRTVYCDGWAHDYPWLAALFDVAGRTPRFRLEHLRALLDDEQARALAATRAQVAAELRLARHRASSDARTLQLALWRLLQARPTR
jgi:DNA polymerase III epsilon subunit-like protein